MIRVFFGILTLLFLISCDKDDDSGNTNCNTPLDVAPTEINSGSVLFTWETNEETAWEIEYGLNGFDLGNGTIKQTSQTSYFIENLLPATNYTVYLRANCGSQGFSDYTSFNFITLEGSASCSAPTDVFVSGLGSNSFGLGWGENGETAWQVEYGPVGFVVGNGTILETSQSNITINGLTPLTTYEVYIRANCGSQGFSIDVGPVVVTTNP